MNTSLDMGSREQPPLYLRIHERMQNEGFTVLHNVTQLRVVGLRRRPVLAKALWSHYRCVETTLIETAIENQEDVLIWNQVYSRLLDKLDFFERELFW